MSKSPAQKGHQTTKIYLLSSIFLAVSAISQPGLAQEDPKDLYTVDKPTQPYIEPGRIGDPNSWRTPEFKTDWGLAKMKADDAYARGATGQGVKIGILDSGVYAQHNEFQDGKLHLLAVQGVYGSTFNIYNTADDLNDPLNKKNVAGQHHPGEPFDVPGDYNSAYNNMHATEMSALAAATRNGVGMHGVAFNADLYSANTGGTDNNQHFGSNDLDYNYYKAAYDALGQAGVQMVNNSWGQDSRIFLETLTGDTQHPDESLSNFLRADRGFWAKSENNEKTWLDAVIEATKKYHYVQVFSADNSDYAASPDMGASQPFFHPELEGSWVAVTGYDQANAQVYNQCGVTKWFCLMGPSGEPSAFVDNPYNYTKNANGTSASAPNISGALAVVMSRYPYMTPQQALQVLFTTAQNKVMNPDQTGAKRSLTYGPLNQTLKFDTSQGSLTYGVLTWVINGNSGVPNNVGGWGLPDLQKAMNGPGQLFGHFAPNLPKGISDTWSNNISDVAIQARKADDQLVVEGMQQILKDGHWHIEDLQYDLSSDNAKNWQLFKDMAYISAEDEALIKQMIATGGALTDSDKRELSHTIEAWQNAMASRGEDPITGATYVGSLEKLGGGKLTLSGNNTYTGSTWVRDGELDISPSGSIISSAVVDGPGLLTVEGTATNVQVNRGGALAVSGQTTDVTIDGGQASLDGHSAQVSVANGGLLNGHGTLQSLSAQSGGIVAPGNSIGTLHVTGNATFEPGSFFAVEVAPDQRSDQLDVAGTAQLNGGTVTVSWEHDPNLLSKQQVNSLIGQHYTILNAAQVVNGQFAQIMPNYLFLGTTLEYQPHSVQLNVGRNDTPFARFAQTDNQRAVATGADSLQPGNPVYESIVLSNAPAEAAYSYGQLETQIYSDITATALQNSQQLRTAVIDHLRQSYGVDSNSQDLATQQVLTADTQLPPLQQAHVQVWSQALGSWNSANGTTGGNTSKYNGTSAGLAVGVEHVNQDNARIGLVGSYTHDTVDIGAHSQKGKVDNYNVGLYGGQQWGPLGLRAGASYGWNNIDTSRNVYLPGQTGSRIQGHYSANTVQLFGDLGYTIDTGLQQAALEPFVTVAYVHYDHGAIHEHGSAAALQGDANSQDATLSTVGLRAGSWLDLDDEEHKLRISGSAGWQHDYNQITPITALRFDGGQTFNITGAPIARNAAVVGASVGTNVNDRATVNLGYQGTLASRVRDNSIRASFNWMF